ncbi:MAG: peptide-methionine (S)-S-oxide reductase MsrA [Halieaceae bacterium]|jgi:peptide-methionine (S)-S-oxide reductase|nr:peptide-methionine (S)-S-oxide reductase MsrA [Halieaceae bacterium]
MNKLHTALVALFLSAAMQAGAATAVFAGGCFWCMEAAYQDVPGVTDVVSGFTGGSHPNPTYNGAHTGHYEAVEVTYDPGQISFEQLLILFWANVDPFDGDGQFCDRGESYRPAIFVAGDGERAVAEASKRAVQAQFPDRELAVPVLDRAKFFPVEAYHQDYYKKSATRYKFYRFACGRDRRLEEVWEGTPWWEKSRALSGEH